MPHTETKDSSATRYHILCVCYAFVFLVIQVFFFHFPVRRPAIEPPGYVEEGKESKSFLIPEGTPLELMKQFVSGVLEPNVAIRLRTNTGLSKAIIGVLTCEVPASTDFLVYFLNLFRTLGTKQDEAIAARVLKNLSVGIAQLQNAPSNVSFLLEQTGPVESENILFMHYFHPSVFEVLRRSLPQCLYLGEFGVGALTAEQEPFFFLPRYFSLSKFASLLSEASGAKPKDKDLGSLIQLAEKARLPLYLLSRLFAWLLNLFPASRQVELRLLHFRGSTFRQKLVALNLAGFEFLQDVNHIVRGERKDRMTFTSTMCVDGSEKVFVTERLSHHPAFVGCDFCLKKEAKKLLFCSRCRIARYCDKNCQTKHWGLHKKDCPPL